VGSDEAEEQRLSTELTAANGLARIPYTLTLLCGLDCPRSAREEVAARVDGVVSQVVGEDLALLVSELVTNVIKHGNTNGDAVVTICGSVIGTTLRTEVTNVGPPFRPRPVSLGSGGVGGRGLYLVDAMSGDWGMRHADGETTVWFEMDLQTPKPLPVV
jgi:anti-sigma regulatory factor (Ser/Thr protein kinase)